jgi:MATE family multidrug resistance protein
MDVPAAGAAIPAGGPRGVIQTELTALLRLAGPVVLARLGIMTMGLTDAIVVGRFSPIQLGYHALGWAPTSVMVVVVISLLTGVQVMTSRAIGEGRRHAAGAVLRRGLTYALWLGLASSLLLAVFGPPLLHSVGLGRDLADGAGRVLVIFSLSLTPYVVSVAASLWLEALSKPSPAMAMMWLANVVNLAIDLVLVPGRFGLPALGAIGGACATLGARTVLALALLIYIATMRESRALGVFTKPPRERAAEAEQRRVGYGAGASGFFEVAAFAGMNLITGWIGPLAVAGYTVVLNMVALVFMVPLGLSTATAVLVGRAYGARDRRGVNRAGAIGFAVTASFGLIVSVLVAVAARAIVGAYTTDARLIALAVPALVLSCLFVIPDALQVVVAQSLRARGDVWAPSVTHFISYAVIMAPLAWVLALPAGLGLNGVIWAIVAASLMSAGLLLARFWMQARRDLA